MSRQSTGMSNSDNSYRPLPEPLPGHLPRLAELWLERHRTLGHGSQNLFQHPTREETLCRPAMREKEEPVLLMISVRRTGSIGRPKQPSEWDPKVRQSFPIERSLVPKGEDRTSGRVLRVGTWPAVAELLAVCMQGKLRRGRPSAPRPAGSTNREIRSSPSLPTEIWRFSQQQQPSFPGCPCPAPEVSFWPPALAGTGERHEDAPSCVDDPAHPPNLDPLAVPPPCRQAAALLLTTHKGPSHPSTLPSLPISFPFSRNRPTRQTVLQDI